MTSIAKLVEIMAQLRDPTTGCPWDREQDFRSIAPYTIEEAYEVADAIDRGDFAALRDELGDLLLQVVFHAQLASESGMFDFDDVAAAICDKLIRRHPHVFAAERIDSAAEQRAAWERLKAGERGAQQVLAGVALALPALARATKLGRRAASVGFDWPDAAGVMAKVREELAEVEAASVSSPASVGEEIGDLLLAVTSLARHLGVDPEEELRRANAKFERRFSHVERRVTAAGGNWQERSPGELDAYWHESKRDG